MRRKTREPSGGGCPVSALIDVVFLLIVFFLVTMNVQKEIVDRTLELAQAQETKPEEDKNPRRVTVNVRKDGSLNIAKNPISLRELETLLNSTAAQYGNSVPVILRADRATKYRQLDKVMQAIGRAGLYRVRVAARAAE